MSGFKSVYIATDMEGVAGVDERDPRHFDYANLSKGVYDRSEIQRLLTAEVNAAIKGLQECGVEKIIVNDGHGSGRTILPENISSGARLIRGGNRPAECLLGGKNCDALIMIGRHAKANTPNACLAHTMSSGLTYRLNGNEIGEIALLAYSAGFFDVPCVFLSGDNCACHEAEELIEGIVTASVKESISDRAAIHMAPVDARELIRSKVKETMLKKSQVEPLKIEGKVELEIQKTEPWPLKIKEKAMRKDAFTLLYSGNDIQEVFCNLMR